MASLRGQDFRRVDAHALRREFERRTWRSSGRSLADLSRSLTHPLGKSPLDGYRAIFVWVQHNISYVIVPGEDHYEYQHPKEVYASGVARCVGFSALFKYMCNSAGLPCRIVAGPVHGAGPDHELHAWVRVELAEVGGLRYFDPTFAADMRGNDHWFTASAREFCRTHVDSFPLKSKTSELLDW
ncbi:hypothetical protein BJ508DRAFT_127531 [Ascobolus immersus RN42]|uniref:Transglutaminase-like domain-containing protein n=1 Tax=Ascobolus immersus RN42 TaxID=1160509 RepID=A0A3N4I312_ASCIM|nr:hypothetical protein BJ508DRAFT_127531 [Ascobolus immersus RN42]